MDSEKSSVSGISGVKNKQTREQEKQRRRHLTKSASHDQGSGSGTGSQAPVFKPVEKKDSELHKITLNVLGDYNTYKNAMEWGKQTSYFGVADATPSTPIQGSKYSPFDIEFRAASSRGSPSSSSGVSSGSKTMSRHQVAELPVSQPPYYKKEKIRTKLHQKHSSSKMDATSQRSPSNLATSVKSNKEKEMKRPLNSSSRATVDGSTETSQATNTFKSKQKKVRPYKPQVTGSITPATSQSKSNPQSSSLFDFNTSTVGGASSNTLTIHRTSSSSSVTSASSSKPKLSSSDRSNSFNSTPSSRHADSHMISSHSLTSHKHKKLASVQPTPGQVSQKAGEEEQKATPRVVSIKRTSSLEFIKQPQSWEKNAASDVMPVEGGEMTKDDPVALQSSGKSSGKKKEKKPRKKLKKDKVMDAATAESKVATSTGSVMPTSPAVVSATGLVNVTESHVTMNSSAQMKTEVMSMPSLKSRPSDLRFTLTTTTVTSAPQQSVADVATSGVGSDDVSQDAGDVRSMLQEMMKPLDHSYSLVTPIPTPVKTRPFVFPTERHSSSGGGRSSSELTVFKKPSSADSSHKAIVHGGVAAPSRKLSTSSSDDESDPDSKFQMAVENAVSMLDYNLAEESQPQRHTTQRPDSPTLSVSSSSSSSGESSSDSSDSSSEGEREGEGEGEESESNITPTLEKLHRHAQLSGEAITPLKKTPPRSGLTSVTSFLSPIADESANLSPAKPTGRITTSSVLTHSDSSMITSQVSTGFNPTFCSDATTVPASIPASIMSDSSDSDSGSESDSESSDSEDQSSGEEDNVNSRTDSGLKRTSIQSEEATPAPPPFGSSTGFWDETYDLFGATSQVGEHESKRVEQLTQNCQDEAMETGVSASTSHSSSDKQSSRIGKKRKHSSGSQFSLHKAQKLMNSDMEQQIQNFQDEAMEMGVSASSKHSNSDRQSSRIGKKHKHSSGSQFSLHKAQKLMNMVHLSSDAEDGETLLKQKPPHVMATGSSEGKGKRNLSDSEMSEGDEEEGEIPSEDDEIVKKPPSRHQGIEAAVDMQVQNNSANLSRPNQEEGNQSLATIIKQEEVEEDQKEEPDSLVVSFHISNIRKLPMQKPKATVEPFYHHNTSTSKVTRRRNTVDAPGERDGDEVQSRGLSRERGDRSTYNRHREDYGRDYHRASRSHRDSSARWDRESSRDRRMYGNSEERSSRHGSGRHSGWDRDGDYHRDDYWMDSGGTHYDRGTRDYERGGSRQRGETERKRGAEYFMQEARRRKHEADKIQIPGVDKAKAYMESVPYFLRHGDAIEHERQQQNQQWVESGGEASKRKSFKMYSDTLSVVRFCQNMAGDCKPLVVICLRCQSVLLWRMFQLKQVTSSQVQKELQEFFVLPKGTQSKSPYPNNFSPLPSPASVSSTASNGSGGGAFPQDPSPSCAVSVPKHIFNKASEHLAISSYLNQSFDAWKKADSMMEQCREFFLKAERKPGRLYQFSSSIPQAASWVENTLRCLR